MREPPTPTPSPLLPLTILARFDAVTALSDGVAGAVLDLVGPVWSKLGYVGGRLWRPDSAGERLVPAAEWHPGERPIPTPTPVAVGGPSLLGQCWARNRLEWVAWTNWEHGRSRPEAYVCVPLAAGDGVLGVLELAAESTDEPTPDLAALLTKLGRRLGQLAAAQE